MKHEYLPIKSIQLDQHNPRIAKFIEMYGKNPTYEQIALALGVGESDGGATFHSLRESIRTYKGLIHPILVNKQKDGIYVVIEGNTRLAIYREFDQQKIDGEWEKIPCIVHDGLSEAEVDAIRLQAHLVGPRQWDPYSKAKYLHYLRHKEHLTWAQIVDYCGGKAKEASEYVDAYNDMEKYYREVLDDESAFDSTRFSAFVELQKPRIKEAIVQSKFSMHDFAKWIYERRISRLENVRRLPDILGSDSSKKVFLRDGDREAIKILDVMPDHVSVPNLTVVQVARLLAEKLRKITREEITKYKTNSSSSEVVALMDAKDELTELFKLINPDKE